MTETLFGKTISTARAGKSHHGKSGTTTWLTPPDILDAVGGAESFDLDPATAIGMPWATAKRMYNKGDNGLMKPWFGRVWLNPPWGIPSIIGPWMRRMADHGNGIMLIPAATETAMFFECVWRAPSATAILFIEGRLHFHFLDGRRSGANCGTPVVLIAYGEPNATTLQSCNLPGRYLHLR